MTGPRVTLAHCRALGYCAKGLRAFCEQHGLDWEALRTVGLPVATIEATGDGMALAAAQLARSEQGER